MNDTLARWIDAGELPVIDMAPLTRDAPGDEAAAMAALVQVGQETREAAEAVGFFYVRNHAIPRELIARTDARARAFFALPLEQKLACRPVDLHRGFLQVGQAKMHERARVDLKESFVWGRDVGADDADYLAGNRMIGPNRWPQSMPELRTTLNAYLDAAHQCARRLLGAMAISLEQPADYFVRQFAKPVSRGTLVYYPPQPADASEDQFGVAAHTDYGVITLLHQDDVGGLEVLTRDGRWVSAPPIPDTLVINSGDLLGRWTNDRFKSNPHRVVNRSGRERLSIAVFADPDYDTPIVPVTVADEAARYPVVSFGDYILSRFDAAFAYRQGTQTA